MHTYVHIHTLEVRNGRRMYVYICVGMYVCICVRVYTYIPLRCGKVGESPLASASEMGLNRMGSSPPSPEFDLAAATAAASVLNPKPSPPSLEFDLAAAASVLVPLCQ
jgi:hypothetical protein